MHDHAEDHHHHNQHSSDSDGIHPESDDDEIPLDSVGKRGWGYTTFGNNNSSKRRKRGREESLYGVFAVGEEDDDGERWKRGVDNLAKEVTFVKSGSTDTKQREGEEKDEKVEDKTKAMEEANARFESLLSRGRGEKRMRPASPPPPPPPEPATVPEDGEGIGFGLGFTPSESGLGGFTSSESGLGVAASPFGLGFRPAPKPPKSSNLAKWEKHTKGIGTKLLSKMGFTGSGGLGTRRRTTESKGISRPVEVVVRPANLGLGYGDFKEASQLKANRQIEAEVLGVTKEEKKEGEEDSILERLMKQENRANHQKASQKPIPKKASSSTEFVSMQDILKGSEAPPPTKIIDMRGPQSVSGEIPLGEEVLHNLTLLVQSDDANFHSANHLLTSTSLKLTSLQQHRNQLKSKLTDMERKRHRLQNAQSIITNIQSSLSNDDMSQLRDLIETLQSNFTVEERQSLRFHDIVLPSLLQPVLTREFANWNPFREPQKIAQIIYKYNSLLSDYQLLSMHVLPLVESAFATEWDVMKDDPNPCLELYTVLQTVARPYQDVDLQMEMPQPSILVDQLFENTIYPKLCRAVTNWTPECPPLHHWILPWLPYLRPILKSNLLTDIKRKLRSAFKSITPTLSSLRQTLESLTPWKSILENSELHRLLKDFVSSNLAKYCATIRNVRQPKPLSILDEYRGLLPPHHYESILEGEVFLPLLNHLYDSLSKNAWKVEEIPQWYRDWKSIVPTKVLNQDKRLCGYFYTALRMIQCHCLHQSLKELRPPTANCNYNTILRKRLKDSRDRETFQIPTEAAIPLKAKAGASTSTFRQVVEEYANEHGVLFQPKLMGGNTLKDGKQVYLLGDDCQVYLDDGIVFQKIGKEWTPVRLEELIMKIKGIS